VPPLFLNGSSSEIIAQDSSEKKKLLTHFILQITVQRFLLLTNCFYVEEKVIGQGCFVVAAADTVQKS